MANQGLGVGIQVEGMKEFNKIFNEYLAFQKKAPSEVVNHKLLNIAIRAKNNTKKADPMRLKQDVLAPSRNNPKKSVGEMVVLSQLQKKGKMPKRTKTLQNNMAKLVQRLINKERTHIGFLAVGWLPAIKGLFNLRKLGDITFAKRFMVRDTSKGVKQFGKDKGKVTPANPTPRCFGIITNDVGVETPKQKKSPNDKRSSAIPYNLAQAARKALIDETADINDYMERKWKQQLDKTNKKMSFK